MQPNEQEIETLLEFLKVLADKSRIRILGILSEKEATVKEIAAELGLKEPTVSVHLALLKSCGLAVMRQQGTSHYYSLRQESIHGLLKDLSERAKEEMTEDPNYSDFEKRVLRNYFKGGKLLDFPTKQSKQLVIIKRLSQEFRIGAFYNELEVNAILKPIFADFATLRRLLVDWHFMARKDGSYWRTEPEVESIPS